MRAAVSIWNERISPVFDSSRRLLVLDIEDGEISARSEEEFADLDPLHKLERLIELKVEVLVCGAVSRPLHEMAVARGIRVIPFVKGDVSEVIRAWLDGALENEAFIMPGCCGRRRRRVLGVGVGTGRTESRGRGRRGGAGCRGESRGLSGGSLGAGQGGFCQCPQCGHREAHQQGVPCVHRQCPRCGTAMTRE